MVRLGKKARNGSLSKIAPPCGASTIQPPRSGEWVINYAITESEIKNPQWCLHEDIGTGLGIHSSHLGVLTRRISLYTSSKKVPWLG